MKPWKAILLGGLVVGVLDITDAFVFFGIRNGIAPGRILQGIASGLLGRASFDGGVLTMFLGAVLHFFIATTIVATYVLISRRMPVLSRWPFVLGPLYGIVVYIAMNYMVVPLSAAAHGPKKPIVVVNGLLIHMLGVGLPSALAARAASRASEKGEA